MSPKVIFWPRCEHYFDSALFVLGLEARVAFELAQQLGYRIIPADEGRSAEPVGKPV
jgi:hypothetical protein